MSAQTTVAGERGPPLQEPGAARRAAGYRLVFGICLVVATAAALLVTYWHHHHPQVTETSRSRTPRAAATEMRLPKLMLETPPAAAGPTSVPASAGNTVAPVPALPQAALEHPPAASRHSVSPVLVQTAGQRDTPIPPSPSVAPTPVRTEVKVLHALPLPAAQFLLPRGSFLDCTLETAVDSTLPGLATCLLSGDVYGADGKVVLLPRGSRLVGEVRSDVRAGQARVGIIWTEARTPQGLLLPLGAAGTDALGRTGVPGVVDRHSVERFGAAVMLSVIDAGASALVNRRTPGTGVVYNIQGTRDVATEALRQSIHIPPTIQVAPGARVDVIVTADVDFAEVYRLVSHEHE